MNYFIFSYGGCGSTMLSSFLSHYGKNYHLHDKTPPLFLTSRLKPVPGGHTPALVRMSENSKYRLGPHMCRTIYIYRDPVLAKISRPSWKHCCHIGGRFEEHKRLKKQHGDLGVKLLQSYAQQGQDLNQYEEHFDNWIIEGKKREYSILYLNYAYLWKNLNTILRYCEIPIQDAINKFPKKKETKKPISDDIRHQLSSIHVSLQEKINELNPVIISNMQSLHGEKN